MKWKTTLVAGIATFSFIAVAPPAHADYYFPNMTMLAYSPTGPVHYACWTPAVGGITVRSHLVGYGGAARAGFIVYKHDTRIVSSTTQTVTTELAFSDGEILLPVGTRFSLVEWLGGADPTQPVSTRTVTPSDFWPC
ncbi:MAG: hypothetical protein WAV45_17305 [Propionibacteriaceae bacterium]|nr:hypothetical protein [Micropruina sp.]HBX81746.1 hypothetical protein [Propionibacteriaceae bacterium]HBY23200.1 hypothetical protein [Propionibacteriaceae bacterium]